MKLLVNSAGSWGSVYICYGSIYISLRCEMSRSYWSWSSNDTRDSESTHDRYLCRIYIEISILLIDQKATKVSSTTDIVKSGGGPWKPCSIGSISKTHCSCDSVDIKCGSRCICSDTNSSCCGYYHLSTCI